MQLVAAHLFKDDLLLARFHTFGGHLHIHGPAEIDNGPDDAFDLRIDAQLSGEGLVYLELVDTVSLAMARSSMRDAYKFEKLVQG